MDFLGPTANAELVHKFLVTLHASRAILPILTSKLSPSVAPPMSKSKFHHVLPHGLVPELGVLTSCSGTLHNFSPCSAFIYTFFTSKRLTFSPTHYYQDERAHPGDLHNSKLLSLSSSIKCSVSHCPPHLVPFLSLFGFKRLRATFLK
jgi:hypothetical protein